jgi:hypothetical protein
VSQHATNDLASLREVAVRQHSLTDHGWHSQPFIWLLGHADSLLTRQRDERLMSLLPLVLQDQARRRRPAKSAGGATMKKQEGCFTVSYLQGV